MLQDSQNDPLPLKPLASAWPSDKLDGQELPGTNNHAFRQVHLLQIQQLYWNCAKNFHQVTSWILCIQLKSEDAREESFDIGTLSLLARAMTCSSGESVKAWQATVEIEDRKQMKGSHF